MPAAVSLDHLAVGVRSWGEGFRRFAGELGGRWSHGGDAGEFAPCQLLYPAGIKLELIAPGSAADGFMHRFIERGGPGPHHITFKVSSLAAVLDEVAALGIGVLDGRTRQSFWREAFLHPKQCGLGTLLQLVQSDDAAIERIARASPAPDSFPAGPRQAAPPAGGVVWTGLTVESLERARELFTGALRGDVAEHGPGWLRVTWGPGRDLLVRSGAASPGGAALWASRDPGVAHLLFARGPLTVSQLESGAARVEPMPFDEATAIAVWLSADTALES